MVLADQPTAIGPYDRTSWGINDAVTRVRLWATEYAHPLPEPRVGLKLGSGSKCEVRLHDKAGLLSREHAQLVPAAEASGWEIHDLASKNGLWVDGLKTAKAVLQPGVKIELGGLTLVAESLQFIALRSLMCRLIGWAPARRSEVDEALQNLRHCAIQRTPLVLIGSGDLVPIAARLHRGTLGPAIPFVTDQGGDIDAAFGSAAQGTLCVSTGGRDRASKVAAAVDALEVTARPRLILCAATQGHAALLGARTGRLAVIALPSLATRSDEILRLVHETADDLVGEMKARTSGFTMHDLERLQRIKFSGIADLEDSVRRVIAMRIWGVTKGAEKLGVKHSSLSKWTRAKNRKLST